MSHRKDGRHAAAGFTLLEMIFAMAILTMVMGTLFGLALSIGDTARVQEARLNIQDEARRALLLLEPDVRQAAASTINWNQLPGETLTYRVADDMDGNGVAVNRDVRLELGLTRTIQRDRDDLNGDGLTDSQLIAVTSAGVLVLANNLTPESEQPTEDGVFGVAEDTNGNGRVDRGIWFEPWGAGALRITVQTQDTDRRGHVTTFVLNAIIDPRN